MTCKVCNKILPTGMAELRAHYNAEHGGYPTKKKSKGATDSDSVIDRITEGRNMIKRALNDAEQERDQMQRKLLEFDDLISKYKKLL